MLPDIIINHIDELYFDNYAIYTEKKKLTNTLILKAYIYEADKIIVFAKLPLNVEFAIRLEEKNVIILQNKKPIIIFNIEDLIKITNNKKYNTPLILKRKK